MNKSMYAVSVLLVGVVSGWAASVTVNQSGTGNYTNIQAAIDSGASLITITDSGNYIEDLQIGDVGTNGPPVTLTSNQTGTNRPVITPVAGIIYENTRRGSQTAGFGLLANNSVVSNLIIEALAPGAGAMMVMADNARIENCLFRISTNFPATLGSFSPLLFFSQEGSAGVPTPGGRDCNGCLVRNCEFIGLAPDAVPVEPTGTGFDAIGGTNDNSGGYLLERGGGLGTGQSSGHGRLDHYSDGRDVFITYEGCYFHHSRDYGIFPSNYGSGAGSINLVIKKCRFDATSKFCIRGRGANVIVEDSVFTRSTQGNNGDTENSAVAINAQDGHADNFGSVKNCVFVNCGSANAQRAYYGGVNYHSGGFVTVDHCTFADCLTGVGAGTDANAPGSLTVSNSIFHQIGDNVVPSVNNIGITLTNGSPELVGGLYPAWTNGLAARFGNYKWSAVFNRFTAGSSQIIITNCMVGSIDTEDTRTWEDALAANQADPTNSVTGCRLFAGWDTNFVGAGSILRSTPVFVNTDPDAPNAFQLAQGSPGQGLGANLGPVLQPVLHISQAGNAVTISWSQPLWMKGYALKSTSSLSSPSWGAVAGVTSFGVAYSAIVNIGAGSQFFALLKQ